MGLRGSGSPVLLCLLLLTLYNADHCIGQATAKNDLVRNTQDCGALWKNAEAQASSNSTRAPAGQEQTILLWQGIVLLLCFGAFTLFITLVHKLVRTYVYYDAHLLDTFFDGGGDMNVGLIACSVVGKWAWTASLTWAATSTMEYGLVGHFWYAAGAVIHIFLFSIMASEIRIKAPGAKTYLQVIRARFGAAPHIIVTIFALFACVIISGMVMTEGTRILTYLTKDMGKEVTSIVLAIVIGFFTVVGGVGGGMYVAYFACATMLTIVLVYVCEVYYNPLGTDAADLKFGSAESIYDLVKCGKGDDDNDDSSLVTFLSRGGMIQGILIILSSFSSVFVDQSFWQTAVSAKPGHAVWGFILGGLVWFAIPFCGAFAFGMSYWALAIEKGGHLVSEHDALFGRLPALTSNELMGNTGDFLMFVFVMFVVVTTASAEVLAASSIIIYDIYQTYIAPFRATSVPQNKEMSLRMQRAIRNEEYLEYDKRCMVLKHVVVVCVTCLLIPITLVVWAIEIDLPWLFKFLGIMVGSCVIPICLAVTWHRITALGLSTGVIGGWAVAVITWLAYSSTFEGGLENFRENTGRDEPMLSGLCIALGLGGLLCIIISLACGGCDQDILEEEEWEKTRSIDNPVLPWYVKYAPDIGSRHLGKGRPHFFTVRRTFKTPEVCAYIIGVLLAVLMVLVWPAAMLTADIFSENTFKAWTIVVTVWACVATGFIILVPLLWEIVQTCRQAYYNRQWARLEEKDSTVTPSDPGIAVITAPPHHDNQSYKTDFESDYHSTVGPDSGISGSDVNKKERWKTFIRLD